MKINKNSWHYKLSRDEYRIFGLKVLEKISERCIESNLCGYIQHILSRVWLTLFISLFFVLFGYIIGSSLISVIIFPFVNVGSYIQTLFGATGFVGCLMLGFVLLCILIYYLCVKTRSILQVNEHEESNIFFEYIKAKKNKYCPTIEFVDNDR